MSRIIFDNNYVIVQPGFREVQPHKHSFYHIFFLWENDLCSEIYVVGSNMLHTMNCLKSITSSLQLSRDLPTGILADIL